MSKSICVITHSAYPTEVRARRMAEALVESGYRVDVLCLRLPGQPVEDTVGGVHVLRLPVSRHQGAGASTYLQEYARFFLLAGRRLLALHRRQHYALVQVHNPPDALVFATLPLRIAGVPVMLDLREVAPELFISRFGLGPRSLIVRLVTLWERWACKYADAVLILHDRHRRVLASRGITGEKLVQVMNCPDERLFNPTVRSMAAPHDGRFRVVHHGGIFERYGVDLLVDAVAQLRSQIPDIRLDLYGEGDFRPRVEAMVAENRLQDTVFLHGQLPLEQIPAAIATADVGVAPMRQTIFTDCGLPTKLLEYVAMGIPAITSRTATTADYFDDSIVHLFAPGEAAELAEKILDVYLRPDDALKRAQRALGFSAEHNWSHERQPYLETVRNLTERK